MLLKKSNSDKKSKNNFLGGVCDANVVYSAFISDFNYAFYRRNWY